MVEEGIPLHLSKVYFVNHQKYLVGMELVTCWRTSHYQKDSFLVFGRGMSNMLEMLLACILSCKSRTNELLWFTTIRMVLLKDFPHQMKPNMRLQKNFSCIQCKNSITCLRFRLIYHRNLIPMWLWCQSICHVRWCGTNCCRLRNLRSGWIIPTFIWFWQANRGNLHGWGRMVFYLCRRWLLEKRVSFILNGRGWILISAFQ